MYTDEDLYSAVKVGIFDESAVESFRKFMEKSSNTQHADDENFRLISGFNDIFVAMASLLFIVSATWLFSKFSGALAFFFCAAVSWLLSLNFVLKRKLALPAILFLVTYVVGVIGFSWSVMHQFGVDDELLTVGSFACAVLMTYFHWIKFRVPITAAACVACVSAIVISGFLAAFPDLSRQLNLVTAVCGLFTFATAMYWDAQDTERKSRKSDVAFWLHLLAAPLIVHPVFLILDIEHVDMSGIAIILVVFVYVLLGVVSLAVDRRALMVSALIYVIYAFAAFFKSYGALSNGFAISGLLIGGLLIFLSAAWNLVRAKILLLFPDNIKQYLPAPGSKL